MGQPIKLGVLRRFLTEERVSQFGRGGGKVGWGVLLELTERDGETDHVRCDGGVLLQAGCIDDFVGVVLLIANLRSK